MAESATPTSISTITATIIPEASARASDSMISLPIPRSAPMNSPTMTPISAKEIAGESEANTQAIIEESDRAGDLPFVGAKQPRNINKTFVDRTRTLERIEEHQEHHHDVT